MHCKDREGKIIHRDNGQDNFLKGLYGTVLGRKFLKILINPTISKLGGAVLSTKLSSLLVKPFIKANNIDMSDYTERAYASFNDFFTRDLKPGKRFINRDKEVLISPSDGRVSVYEIDDNMTFNIKDSYYTISDLLNLYYSFDYFKKMAIQKVYKLTNYEEIIKISDKGIDLRLLEKM